MVSLEEFILLGLCLSVSVAIVLFWGELKSRILSVLRFNGSTAYQKMSGNDDPTNVWRSDITGNKIAIVFSDRSVNTAFDEIFDAVISVEEIRKMRSSSSLVNSEKSFELKKNKPSENAEMEKKEDQSNSIEKEEGDDDVVKNEKKGSRVSDEILKGIASQFEE